MNLNDTVEKLNREGYQFNLEKYFMQGFELFKKEAGLFIGFTVVSILMSLIAGVIPVVGRVLQTIIMSIVNLGYFYVARKIKNGKAVTFEDFFKPFNAFGDIIGVALVVFLLTILATLCLIIPGIYLGIAWMFAVPIAYFYKPSLWGSMEASRIIITKNWWWFLVLILSVLVLNILGAICLLVGLLVTIPVSQLIFYAVFDDIFKLDEGENLSQKENKSL